jgi:hypothetical protein
MKFAFAIGLLNAALVTLASPEAKAGWVSTNGPLGVETQWLHGTPARLFAATQSGLFTTTDYASWTLDSALGSFNVSSVVTSDNPPNQIVIVGTLGSGIYRSLTGGASWTSASAGLGNLTVRAMASVEDPYSGTVYFAGTDAGVYRGFSYGSSWGTRGLTPHSVRALAFYWEGDSDEDGLGGHDLLAGTAGSGVFLYTSDGMGWLSKNKNLTNLFITALAASSTYAVTFAGTAGGGVFRSDSVYGSWAPINSGLTDWNVSALATSGAKVFVGTPGSGVFAAAADGNTGFVPVNAGLTDLQIKALATDGTSLFAATEAGVFRRLLSEI